ncbi:MAG: DUF3859 domain-containing protein [Bacteroidota bacterium]|nr:DUF3859 domain-containing protein [Bacteroidota bacterium]
MTKSKLEVEIFSYGEYEHWDQSDRSLPRLIKITDKIPARIGTEFGYVLRIRKGKGQKLSYRIDHPPFKDADGNVTPSFTGEYFISSNDYEFFLGDCIWEPLEDKLGKWVITTYHEGKVIAQKSLTLL